MMLEPITLTAAKLYVERYHRHHKPPVSGLFAIAASKKGGGIVGVIIVGRPVSRNLDDGYTVEITRCCTDGTKNACSFLYGAAWKAARALGYRRALTFTLPIEGGASLRACGWVNDGQTPGRSWSVPSRPRKDKHPLGIKDRWVVKTHDFRQESRAISRDIKKEESTQQELPLQ